MRIIIVVRLEAQTRTFSGSLVFTCGN